MNKELHSNEEVSAALELLIGTLREEKDRIFSVGSKAMNKQDVNTAKAVLEFADRLEDFQAEVEKLVKKWDALIDMREQSTPEVREIVTGKGRLFGVKPRKSASGFTRTVNHPLAAKSNFAVEFPDGTVIDEHLAKETFIKAIEKMGTAKVFALNTICCGEPLVSRERSKKYPTISREVKGGYYILTHSSTKQKAYILNAIAKKLSINLKVTTKAAGNITESKKTALVKYCKSLKTTYSYKPVLVMCLASKGAEGGAFSVGEITKFFIQYYKNRLQSGLVAEKSKSPFATLKVDPVAAREVILKNPIAVLQKDGVITYDKQADQVQFTEKYALSEASIPSIQKACEAKLAAYYSKPSVKA